MLGAWPAPPPPAEVDLGKNAGGRKLTVSAVRLHEAEKPDGLVSEIYELEIDFSYIEPVTISIPVKELPKAKDENASLMLGIGREVLFEDGNRDIIYRYVAAEYAGGIATASFVPADFAELTVKGSSGGGRTLAQRLANLVVGTFLVRRLWDGGHFVVYFPPGAYGPGRALPWESREALFDDLEAIYEKYKNLGYVYAKRNLGKRPMEVIVQDLDYEGLYAVDGLFGSAGRIYIDTQFFQPGYQSARAKPLLAHEFFHFVQFNYVQLWSDNLWFSEATATYFEYKVSGTGTIPSIVMEYKEKIFAGAFPPENTTAHGYARMPLIKYLAHRRGEDFIRKAYEMIKKGRTVWEDAILSTTGPPARWVGDFYTALVKGEVSKYAPYTLHANLAMGEMGEIGTRLALVVPEADPTAARQGYGQDLALGATTLSVDGLGAKLVAITISDEELKKLPDRQNPMVSVLGAELIVFAIRGTHVRVLETIAGHVVLTDFKQEKGRQTRFLALVVGLHERGKADYRLSVDIVPPAVATPTPTPTPAVVTPTPTPTPRRAATPTPSGRAGWYLVEVKQHTSPNAGLRDHAGKLRFVGAEGGKGNFTITRWIDFTYRPGTRRRVYETVSQVRWEHPPAYLEPGQKVSIRLTHSVRNLEGYPGPAFVRVNFFVYHGGRGYTRNFTFVTPNANPIIPGDFTIQGNFAGVLQGDQVVPMGRLVGDRSVIVISLLERYGFSYYYEWRE
jgi:hypothetical protein